MKNAVPHLLALLVGLSSFVAGNIMLLAPYVMEGAPHSNIRDIIGASLLAFAFVCVLPAKIDKAVSVFRRANPWHRRSTDEPVVKEEE